MYNYEINPNLKKILRKLLKKDKSIYEQISNKINEVINSPDVEHYKNLRYDMKGFKAVHIGHFVLIFKLDKEDDLISFEDYVLQV